jgi:hypothetical protein
VPKKLSALGEYDYPVSCDVSETPVNHHGLSLKPFRTDTSIKFATLRERKKANFVLNGSSIVFTEALLFPNKEGRYLCREVAVPGMSGSGAFDNQKTLHVLAQSAVDSLERGNQKATLWMPAVSFK